MKLKRENWSPTAFERADGSMCVPGEYVEVDEKTADMLKLRGYSEVIEEAAPPKPQKKKPSKDAGKE